MPLPPSILVGGFAKPLEAAVLCYLDGDGNPVPITALTPLPSGAAASPATYVDGSGTIAVGGTSQQVFAANASRRYLLIQNQSDTDLWANFGVAALGSQPSVKIAANGGFFEPLIPPGAAVNIIGATSGKAFTAKQG